MAEMPLHPVESAELALRLGTFEEASIATALEEVRPVTHDNGC